MKHFFPMTADKPILTVYRNFKCKIHVDLCNQCQLCPANIFDKKWTVNP